MRETCQLVLLQVNAYSRWSEAESVETKYLVPSLLSFLRLIIGSLVAARTALVSDSKSALPSKFVLVTIPRGEPELVCSGGNSTTTGFVMATCGVAELLDDFFPQPAIKIVAAITPVMIAIFIRCE
jgi:hypothetical protein